MSVSLRRISNRFLRHFGYQLSRMDPRLDTSMAVYGSADYRERPEYGASNIRTKYENAAQGIPFEFPDILNVNRAVVNLVADATKIVELGGGTGFFAYEAAANSSRRIICSEFDAETVAWAREHRSRPNIIYVNGPVDPAQGPFDLLVSIEVIEHIADYPGFLRTCTALAPRALLTTPNRARTPHDFTAGPPRYYKHVREWTAGEFYWVLRCFYRQVTLYAMASQADPIVVPIMVDDQRSAVIADCRDPIS